MAAATVMFASSAGAAPPIRVNVNGTPVPFTGTPPTEIKGAVLVPLRGVFQALGASVNYNPATKTITARKGSANVVLPLGATTATVNGRLQTLSQPAQALGGTTLVPLRFVAQALGAYVQWDAASSTVQIKTQDPHLASLPAPQGGTVVGQLTGVYTDTNPTQITVRVNGRNTAVPYTPSTIFLRSAPGQPGMQVTPAQLQTGDQVTVQRGPDGNAQSVTATFGEVRGTIKSIGKLANGDTTITLNDGTTVEMAPGAPVTMAGRHVTLADVMTNEDVVIRTNPSNSLGYGIAVVTGNNPNPTPPGQAPQPSPPASDNGGAAHQSAFPASPSSGAGGSSVTVDSFTQDASRPLKAGDVLTATLRGTPGGKASFAVPGIAETLPMRETAPGVYTGTFTVPKDVSVVGDAVIGKLTVGGITGPLIQAAGAVTIDSVPPRITDLSPAKGATVDTDTPAIYATFSDAGGSGVDPASAALSLDGTDVTPQATVTPAFFSLKPADALAPGAHTVKITVADKAGNLATAQWSFDVSGQKRIQSFTSSATAGQPLAAGGTVRFTLRAQPGGKAAVTVGGLAKDLPLSEASPGVYTGEWTPTEGQTAQAAPVTARFTDKSGRTVSTTLAGGLTVAAGPPAAPKILSPEDGADVPETVSVSGTAAPGATVRVTTTFLSKALGGILPIRGSLGSKEATAGRDGKWTVSDIALRINSLLGSSRDTSFTLSAVTVDANGDESTPAAITVRRG